MLISVEGDACWQVSVSARISKSFAAGLVVVYR